MNAFTTKTVNYFLKEKNISWHNFEIYDAKTATFRTAVDKDFNGDFVTLLNCIDSNKEFYYETNVMVSNYKFYIYEDGLIAQDLSDEWQEYLLTHTKGYAKYLYLKYERDKADVKKNYEHKLEVLQKQIKELENEEHQKLEEIKLLQKTLSKGFDAADVKWVLDHKYDNLNQL